MKTQETIKAHALQWKIRKTAMNLKRGLPNLLLLAMAGAGFFYFTAAPVSNLPLQWIVPAVFVLLALSVRMAFDWERVPVLRFGKFRRTRGPGLFFIVPGMDMVVDYVDCRVRVTDFSAERILTKDSVPVYVDAIIFWMIWDAKKATLEVEEYPYAVSLSAITALREIIGKNLLSRVLTDRDGLGKQLQKIMDAKTNPWGITSLSVEIKDIVLPAELEDAMSREAQAEREHNARLILADSEIAVAERMKKAGESYKGDPQVFQLRAMNMVYDGLRQSKGSMIMVPSSALESMNLGTTVGLAAMRKMEEQNSAGAGTEVFPAEKAPNPE
jgi:regulator of protease activity HflC (stomatin/prohibitin superfamily)